MVNQSQVSTSGEQNPQETGKSFRRATLLKPVGNGCGAVELDLQELKSHKHWLAVTSWHQL